MLALLLGLHRYADTNRRHPGSLVAQQGILDSILRSAQLIFTVPRAAGNEAKDEHEDEGEDEDKDELSRACLAGICWPELALGASVCLCFNSC
uniref:GG11556 n=1 Tax=Drosophila erecta TaxID=7220 RepID=B3P611_DROER